MSDAQSDPRADSREAGRWSWYSSMDEELPPDQVRTGELTIEDDHTAPGSATNGLDATIKVDPSKSPKEIDLTYTDGTQKGKTVKGIFKMNGDDLTICRGLTEQEARPPTLPPHRFEPIARDLETVEDRRSDPKARRSTTSSSGSRRPGGSSRSRSPAKGSRKSIRERHADLEGETLHLVRRGKGGTRRLQDRPDGESQRRSTSSSPRDPARATAKRASTSPLTDDTQKTCIARPDQPRLTEFAASPDSGHIVEILKREKQ